MNDQHWTYHSITRTIRAFVVMVLLVYPLSTAAEDMNTTNFSDYALSTKLSPDATYTVELLIEHARVDFDSNYWDEWSERSDAREAPDYEPHFSKDHVSAAWRELQDLTRLSFQRVGDAERPIRDLNAIQFFPELSELVLINNDVTDISPLAACKHLKSLHLSKNPIRDISPLAECKQLKSLHLRKNPIRDISAIAKCTNIEELDISEVPIKDLSVLQNLPKLRHLTISIDQIPAFRRLDSLSTLRKLELGLETFDSFDGFPQMPELRVIRGANVNSLKGLNRFTKLENLVNLYGEFSSLEPLRDLKNLTHANIVGSRIQSLEPLAGLSALRDLWVNTEVQEIDLTPLETLPFLHEVTVKCNGEESPSLGKLRDSLSTWDIEFRAPKPRHTPSLKLEVVNKNTFDIYDTKKPFNLTDLNMNEGLLGSELDWLDDQIEELLSADFKKDDDYTIPFKWAGARSRTVVLYSDRAVKDFPRLVLGIQNILSRVKKDWIIYFQSDGVEEEFTVWIYPEKIMLTKEYEKTVRNLIKPN